MAWRHGSVSGHWTDQVMWPTFADKQRNLGKGETRSRIFFKNYFSKLANFILKYRNKYLSLKGQKGQEIGKKKENWKVFLHLIIHWNILRFLTSWLVKIILIQAQLGVTNFLHIIHSPRVTPFIPRSRFTWKKTAEFLEFMSEEYIDIPPNDLLLLFLP